MGCSLESMMYCSCLFGCCSQAVYRFERSAAFAEWLFDGLAAHFGSFEPLCVHVGQFLRVLPHFAAPVAAIAGSFGSLVAFGSRVAE